MELNNNNSEHFWKIRSAKYDKLYWVKDKDYLTNIISEANLDENQIVLDVGTGTGIIANSIKKLVKHIVAIDISNAMLEKGQWNGISVINWDIGEKLFVNNLFDRVFARMVFHHILDNLDRAILRCYDLLKDNGKIIIAEGVPPTNDKKIIDWYTDMFKLKEKRRTFIPEDLCYYLIKNGFKNVDYKIYIMENFNINNWLNNSGIDPKIQDEILRLHLEADPMIKEAYNMKINNGECIVRTKNIIVTGEK